MIFLLFGGGHRLKELGSGDLRDCPRCHNTTVWARFKSFSELTFFFIPLLRWRRREIEACTICGEAVEVPKRERQPAFGLGHAHA